VDTQLVLCYFGVYFIVQFAIIFEHSIHLFKFLDDEISLLDDRLHRDSSSSKHLIDRHELLKLRVVDQLLELLDLVLQRDH